MKKQWMLLGAVVLLNACGGDPSTGLTGPTMPTVPTGPSTEYKLTVVLDSGVVGTPTTGVSTYPAGTKVSYSFAVSSGYTDPAVVRDGTIAALSGTIVMDKDRELIAGAVKIAVVQPEDETTVQTARRVLTASDKVAAYQDYLRELSRLYARYSAEESSERANAVTKKAFGNPADSALVRQMNEALAGQTFDISAIDAGASGSILPATDDKNALSRTRLYYINGIWTSEDEAGKTAMEVLMAVREAGLGQEVATSLFYNYSKVKDARLQAYCTFKGLMAMGQTANPIMAGLSVAICYGKAAAEDVVESAKQISSLLNILSFEATEDSKRLAAAVQQSRQRGDNVIIMGHSQGTLMAQEALNVLNVPDRCVMAVSLAGPLGEETWGLTDCELTGFTVAGDRAWDVILDLGFNFFPRYTTNITADADRIVTGASSGASSLVIAVPEATLIWQKVRLHSIMGSYLAGIESRQAIKEAVFNHIQTLQGRPECSTPSAPIISNPQAFLVSINDPSRCPGSIFDPLNPLPGTLFEHSFDFVDVNGDITQAGARVDVRAEADDGRSVFLVDVPFSLSGDSFSGTITVNLCKLWLTSSTIKETWTLTDANGNTSNELSIVITRPSGANSVAPSAGALLAPSEKL